MARPGITYDQVAAAANNIIAGGERPTIQSIRAVLGTGSPNTIHRHLTAYRKAKGIQESKRPELSAELQSAIIKAMERHARAAVAGMKKELTQSQAEAAELSIAGERIEIEMKDMVEHNQALSDECQRMTALIKERDREIEKLKVEISRNREDIINIRSERDQGLEAKARAEQSAAVAGAKLDIVSEHLDDWKAIAQDLKIQLSEIKRQKGKTADKDVTEYFQRDIEADDQEDRGKSARRYIKLLFEKGCSYSTAAKKLNDEAYPTIDGKPLWTWQAVKKYSK